MVVTKRTLNNRFLRSPSECSCYIDIINLIFLFQLILPEYLIHGIFSVLFLLAGEFLTVLINLPLDAFHIMKYMNRLVTPVGRNRFKLTNRKQTNKRHTRS